MIKLPTRICLSVVINFALHSAPILPADELQSRSFDAQGVKIHYLTQGQGEPVILIHGLHASAALNWKLPGVMDELAKEHRVIALDLRGHGQSDKPDDEDAYGLQLVDDVVLLMDHLKIKKAHVVGYSLGGMVTMKLMCRHPERVLSALIGGMGWLREGSALQKFWERLPDRDGARTPSALVRNIGALALSEKELKSIRVPVEVLVGDRDPAKFLYVQPLQQVRDDWPAIEIPDAGHITCVVKPAFREEVAKWVRKNSKES